MRDVTSSSFPGPHGTCITVQASSWPCDIFGGLAGVAGLAFHGAGVPTRAVETLVDMGVHRTPFIREALVRGFLQQVSPKETWGTAAGGKDPGVRALIWF